MHKKVFLHCSSKTMNKIFTSDLPSNYGLVNDVKDADLAICRLDEDITISTLVSIECPLIIIGTETQSLYIIDLKEKRKLKVTYHLFIPFYREELLKILSVITR